MKKVLIVVSDYYEKVAQGLIKGSTEYFDNNKNDLSDKDISIQYKIVKSPGSFEIPFIINKNKDSYDGFIALGCIIRGETYHFEVISNEVTRKIMNLSIKINKPIGFGILTCENIKQAKLRSDIRKKNKGKEAANACIKLL